MKDRLVGIREVAELTALSRGSIYGLMRQNRFPRPLQVGPKAVRWLESDLQAWMESCPRTGETTAAG